MEIPDKDEGSALGDTSKSTKDSDNDASSSSSSSTAVPVAGVSAIPAQCSTDKEEWKQQLIARQLEYLEAAEQVGLCVRVLVCVCVCVCVCLCHRDEWDQVMVDSWIKAAEVKGVGSN